MLMINLSQENLAFLRDRVRLINQKNGSSIMTIEKYIERQLTNYIKEFKLDQAHHQNQEP